MKTWQRILLVGSLTFFSLGLVLILRSFFGNYDEVVPVAEVSPVVTTEQRLGKAPTTPVASTPLVSAPVPAPVPAPALKQDSIQQLMLLLRVSYDGAGRAVAAELIARKSESIKPLVEALSDRDVRGKAFWCLEKIGTESVDTLIDIGFAAVEQNARDSAKRLVGHFCKVDSSGETLRKLIEARFDRRPMVTATANELYQEICQNSPVSTKPVVEAVTSVNPQ